MRSDRETPAGRLAQWLEELERFDLPDWDSLPELDLYMDQVILLLTRYLAPIDRDSDERSITASIINNYVRMKVMPPPVKKRYSRTHLAYLVIICTLKQSLSIACIQRLLPAGQGEEAARELYTQFIRQYRRSVDFIRGISVRGGRLALEDSGALLMEGGGSLTLTTAILSTLSKSLTEFLLRPEGGAEDEDYDDE